MKIKLLIVTIFLCLLMLVGCGKEVNTAKTAVHQNLLPKIENADPDGSLVLALSGEPTYFNPILYTDSESGSVVDLIFTGLIKVNENLEIVPDIADRWEHNDDGTEWTFYLKKGVLFHDGVELTADDVIFTFQKILDPKTNTVRRSSYIINNKPVQFTKINKYTFKATLPEPFAPFLISMGIGILPKHILEKENINKADFNHNPVGTGPFKFVKYKPADHVLLKRNNTYYGKKAKLAKIFFKIITEANVRLIALRNGEIDLAGIPPKDLPKMETENKVNIFKYDQMLYTYLGFNCRKPPFDNPKVRQAITYSIDKNMIIQSVLKGIGSPAYSPAHPVSWAYNENVEKFEYDPKKSKQILKEEGWKLINGKQMKDGKPFKFSVLIAKGSSTSEKTATIMQQYLKEIGIELEIGILEWSSLLKITNAIKDPKDYDTLLMAWSLGLDPDGYSIWHSDQYPKGFNHNGYSNKIVDALLIKGRQELDQEKRKAIYAKIYQEIAKDQPYLFLWYPKSIVGVSRRVGGFAKPGPAGLLVNIEDVFAVK